jgi:hypothetical protein
MWCVKSEAAMSVASVGSLGQDVGTLVPLQEEGQGFWKLYYLNSKAFSSADTTRQGCPTEVHNV